MSVYGKGINDMYKGWRLENEWNKRVYKTWSHMIERCYDDKYHKRQPTYKNCSVCNRWLTLSNFIHDFKLIDGYDEIKFLNGELCLDKDIKSNGENKEYCLCQCLLVSKSENARQSNKTMDYSNISIKIAQYNKKTNELIKVWNSSYEIEKELGINQGNISQCCKFWEMNCNKEEWYKLHKRNPLKSLGGFIWKYYINEED